MGIKQPDVSNLLRGRFDGFSFERLLGFVRSLDSDVEIKVKRPTNEKNPDHEGRMSLLVACPLKELRLATFNARVETVGTRPFLGEPFKNKRCLMPLSGAADIAVKNLEDCAQRVDLAQIGSDADLQVQGLAVGARNQLQRCQPVFAERDGIPSGSGYDQAENCRSKT